MKLHRVVIAFTSGIMILGSATACGGGNAIDASVDEIMASVEAKIPTRDRASVRVCEFLIQPGNDLSTLEAALTFVTSSLKELESSDDPNGMKTALIGALIGMGDAATVGDETSYRNAAMNLATVCTDIVSGEYGK